MAELPQKIVAEIENIEQALENLNLATERTEKTIVELAAIATFIHNVYNGIENILKQTLKSKKIKISKSETWHRDIIEFSLSNNLISKELSNDLYELLSFRHFFIHAYGFMLDESILENLAEKLPIVWHNFLQNIEASF